MCLSKPVRLGSYDEKLNPHNSPHMKIDTKNSLVYHILSLRGSERGSFPVGCYLTSFSG